MIQPLLLYALFALVFPVCKIAFDNYIEPFFFTGLCLLCAGIVLIVYRFLTDKSKLRVGRQHLVPLLILVFFNIYITSVCERWGLQRMSAVKTCFMYNLCPLFSALFSYILLSERMTRKKWLGFLVAFAGFIPFFIEKSATERATGGLLVFSWAELALVTAALATVVGWIGMRKLVLRGYCSIAANGISMLIGSLLIMATSCACESWNPFPVRDWKHALACVAIITTVSYIMAYNLYGRLLRSYTATFLTAVGLSSPVFAAIFGWYFLGERTGTSFFVSMVCVTAGIYLFYQEELRTEHSKPKNA